MRTPKIISIVFIMSVIMCPAHDAMADFYAGYNDECWVDDAGNDEYWFCGQQKASCRGNGAAKRNTKHWLYHGHTFTHWGRKYYCCNGSGSREGKFVRSDNWIKTEIVTVQLNDGTCKYERKLNACGNVISDVPCTVPDSCTGTRFLRNNECTESCEPDYGFASATSNKCVACPADAAQGIDANGVCIRCNGAQLWDNTAARCIGKSEMHGYSSDILRRCFMCPNDDLFRQCVSILGGTTTGVTNVMISTASKIPSKTIDTSKLGTLNAGKIKEAFASKPQEVLRKCNVKQ